MSTVFDLVLGAFREPLLVTELRDKQLPDDLAQVIRLAAGEDAALQGAVERTGEVPETLIEASVFFLQQVLFAPGADSYRVLGADSDSSQERLRENYRWLMKWLHPDRNQDGWEAVYADRVNVAWQDLKTPDRRAQYDLRVPAASALAPMSTSLVRRSAPVSHAPAGPLLSGSTVRRLPTLVLGTLGIVAAATIAIMYWAQTQTARELSERRRDRSEQVVVDAGIGLQDAAAVNANIDLQDAAPVDTRVGLQQAAAVDAVADVAASGDSQSLHVATAIEPAATDAMPAAPVDRTGDASIADLPAEATLAIATNAPITTAAIESVVASSPQQAAVPLSTPVAAPAAAATPTAVDGAPEVTLAAAEVADSMQVAAPPPAPAPPRGRSIPTAASKVAEARETVPQEAVDTSASRVAAAALAADAKPLPARPANSVPTRPAVAPERPSTAAPVAIAAARPAALAPAPEAHSGADGRLPQAAAPMAIVEATPTPGAAEAVAANPDGAAAIPAVSIPAAAPARSDAEALVREFASAYASGDLARFNRLFSSASAVSGPLEPMRSRFSSTEMRYLEIQQLRWHSEAAHGYVRARFRDTYVPRGGRKAVTESGEIEWTIRVDAGDARIASVARNDIRP